MDVKAIIFDLDDDRRAAIYRELSRGSGSWAANALYAHGRLELDRGRSRTAEKLLREYLARFESGANATDARRLLGDLR